MTDVAICIIAYNRTTSLKRLLTSLEQASYPCPVKLYISVDKSDNDRTETFAKEYVWNFGEKEVILHRENLGLRKHILNCGNLLDKHEALIVLEDDIFVSPGFYRYALAAVDEYRDNDDIAGISLYNFPITYHSWQPFCALTSASDVFLMQNAQSWGQVWLKRQWNEFKEWYDAHCGNFDEMPYLPKSICSWPESSWLKYHTRYCIEKDKYFVYPYRSYSTCFADAGVHTGESSPRFQSVLNDGVADSFRFSPSVIYDTYFENTAVYEWLNLKKEELCIDYYGDNDNRMQRRFWLSRKQLPYKVVRKYALALKPYELNIKYGISGCDLFLYDTAQPSESIESQSVKDSQFFYMYGVEDTTSAVLQRLCESLSQKDLQLKNMKKKKRKYLNRIRVLSSVCLLLLIAILLVVLLN